MNVLPDDLWVSVQAGKTVWDGLQETEVDLGGECGGLGKCGKCRVKVLSAIDSPSEEDRELLSEEELEQGIRLACRTRLDQDMTVYLGEEPEAVTEYFQILTTSHMLGDRYIPVSRLQPLVVKLPVSLLPETDRNGIANLDQVRLAMGTGYQELRPSLHCLRTLPERLGESGFQGAAVLYDQYLLDLQESERANQTYGMVFDLGTSTLVGKILSLIDGSEVAVTSSLNSQYRHGPDIISRLRYIKEHPRGLEQLHNLLIKDLNQITARLLEVSGVRQDEIFVAVAAGNTTMQHLLLSLSPAGIAEAPFSPVVTDGLILTAADVGLNLHPAALLHTMPMKAGYIGGDLISVIMTSGVAEQKDEIILGLDLGTNGEIFLGNGERLLTCSAAAGPALEGARVSNGMIARAGAIEGVTFEEGQLRYRVIGNIKPRGICGSGLVDLVAVLLD